MKNGWTGGQYSMVRILLGAVCGVVFATAAWTGAPSHPLGPEMLIAGALLSIPFTIGWRDRIWAPCIAGVWLFMPAVAVAAAPVLVIHALLPSAPYGAWAARGRVDPAGGWTFRPWLYASAWLLLGLGTVGAGLTPELKATNWAAIYLGLAFTSMGFWSKARPALWAAMTLGHAAWMASTGLFDPAIGLLAITFDPSWIRPRRASGRDLLFYDGTCGLCHRYVRLVLAEDTADAFRLAPIDSEAFRREVPEAGNLPDSIIVRAAGGRTLSRSTAIVRILSRLGGLWRVAGWMLWSIPRPLRDLGYNAVAAVRYRLFARPVASCPILPPHLNERFLDT